MTQVVRLAGDDAAVREIGREAVEALRTQPQAAGALFGRLWSLHQRRRAFIARSGAQPVSAEPDAPRVATGAGYRAVWGTLLCVGLTAALVSAVMLGPSDRKNAFMDPGIAIMVAVVAGAVAIPFLLVTLVLRMPDHQSARTAEMLSVLVGLICAGLLVFRLFAGAGDGRGFSSADVATWSLMTALAVFLIAGIVIRSDVARRASSAASPRGGARSAADDVRQMRRDAEAASTARFEPAVRTAWLSRLDAIGERVDAATIAQARSVTPAAWLTWLAYDGEIDIDGVVPRV